MGKIRFVKTTSTKLKNNTVATELGDDFSSSIIHAHDDNDNGTTDDRLYIGDEMISDKFNLGTVPNLSNHTRSVGGLGETTFEDLSGKSLSEILVAILTPDVLPSSIRFTNAISSMTHHDSHTLNVEILPADTTNKNVTWESSNTSVLTVNNGRVEAVGVGTAKITVTSAADNTKKATQSITVNKIAVDTVDIGEGTVYLEKGATTTFTATILPSNASNQTITWSSTDKSVASFNGGTITAKKGGTVTIKATVDGVPSNERTIIVKPSVVTEPSLTNTYSGESKIDALEYSLPQINDSMFIWNPGVWSDETPVYVDVDPEITVTVPEYTGGGTYTFTGSVTVSNGGIPKDSNNYGYTDRQRGEHTYTSSITVDMINPVLINGYLGNTSDSYDVTELRHYLIDLLQTEETYEVTIPKENEGHAFELDEETNKYKPNKFTIGIPDSFTSFTFLVKNEASGEFEGKDRDEETGEIIPFTQDDMCEISETIDGYEGYTFYVRTEEEFGRVGKSTYKITLRG